MFEVAVLTPNKCLTGRLDPIYLAAGRGTFSDCRDVDLYCDQIFSATFNEVIEIDHVVLGDRDRPTTHRFIVLRTFDTLAQTLAFKLQVEGPEFEVTIVEV
jgi:hypothetical protein